MKRISVYLRWTFLLLLGGFLLYFPREASEGALSGLILSFKTVLPALFPYFVLSGLAVRLGTAGIPGRPFGRIMERLFHLPGGCAPALLLGLLGGYPVGARTGAELYASGRCSRSELSRLLSFCCNGGPGFILGFLGSGIFHISEVKYE